MYVSTRCRTTDVSPDDSLTTHQSKTSCVTKFVQHHPVVPTNHQQYQPTQNTTPSPLHVQIYPSRCLFLHQYCTKRPMLHSRLPHYGGSIQMHEYCTREGVIEDKVPHGTWNLARILMKRGAIILYTLNISPEYGNISL